MRFVIHLDSLSVIESANDRRRVTQVQGKRGDDSPFEVVFVRSGVAEELAASTVLTFGAKQEGKYDAAAVVLENGFTLSGAGETAKYTGNPSFNTVELNDLFAIDGDATNDVAFVDIMAEFTWATDGGAPTTTKTFIFRVHNDVIRGDESTPTSLPSPDEWLAARAVLLPITRTVAEGPPRPYRLRTAFAGENNDFVLESSGSFTSLVIAAATSSTATTDSANLSGTVYTVTVGSPGGGVAGTMTASELLALLILSTPDEFAGLAPGNNGSGNVVPGTYPLVAQAAASLGQKCVVGGSVPLEYTALDPADLTAWTLTGPNGVVPHPSGIGVGYLQMFVNSSNAVDFRTYTPAD